MSIKENLQLAQINQANLRINELNKKISNYNNIVKEKDLEIKKEKDESLRMKRLYTIENQNNIKLNNQITFFQQIINDKENEINNMRKVYALSNCNRDSKINENKYNHINDVNSLKSELKNLIKNYNKIIDDNKSLKAKNNDYASLKINYNEISNKYKILSEKEKEFNNNQKELNELKTNNKILNEENIKYKKFKKS